MLTAEEIKYLQEELQTAKNPLFFYDDDPDGLCSFLLLYKMNPNGRGIIVKSAPKLDSKFLQKVKELNPDKIFVLDLPIIEQEFVDQAQKPIFWLDHHQPLEVKGVKYFNPRIKNPQIYLPTTYLAYQINSNPEWLWIATLGCLADWHLPDFLEGFIAKYPSLLPQNIRSIPAISQYPLGKLIRLFSFLLKGPQSEVNKCVKILTRIKTPQEILEQKTAPGKFLYRRFQMIEEKYEQLLAEAKKEIGKGKLALFSYPESKWSFTSDLSNELSSIYPQKVILICRKKSGEMKCSLRAKVNLLPPLEKALIGIKGSGGGHENACGVVVKEEDWERFLAHFKKELKKEG